MGGQEKVCFGKTHQDIQFKNFQGFMVGPSGPGTENLSRQSSLCPVTTLSDYLDQTQPYRGNIDDLFVLVTVQDPQPALHQTLSRWGKEWLTQAKIGVGVTVGSCRSASTTSALMMGMGLDKILGQVAWVCASTFVNHYLKLMPVPCSSTFSKTSTLPSKTTSSPS